MQSLLRQLIKFPANLLEFSNIQLTTPDAVVGSTPKDVIWTYRKTTLYRYRNSNRTQPVPVLLTFALINRPDIFDLRPGSSFVEFLLEQGYDVYLVDWGYADEEDADLGLGDYALNFLPKAIREVRRTSRAEEISLVGWCIGAALTSMYLAVTPDAPVRNWVPLTMPFDSSNSTYRTWLGSDELDPDWLVQHAPYLPGSSIDLTNKLMKPVPNIVGTPLRLWRQVEDGTVDKAAYQPMAKWVSDNPNFSITAFAEWVTWIYKENRLATGRLRVNGKLVDLSRITQSTLVVTASADHIAPRHGTMPLFDVLTMDDLEHLDGVGGHIGLMAGSRAKREIWPRIHEWLEPRSQAEPQS